MSNGHTQHKTNPKLLTLILSLLITLSMIIPMFQYNTLEVYAEADMGDEDGGGGTATFEGGPLYARTGWLFYCIDLSNNQVTPTVATTSYGDIVDRDGNKLPDSNIYLTSRYGQTASELGIGSTWGAPHTDGGEGRGEEVKNYMLSTGEAGHKRAYSLIERVFGQTYAEQWERKEVYLVFEPFYWYNALGGNGVQVGWRCMTSYMWGNFHKLLGCPEDGMTYFKRYTNKIWPTCVKLDGSPETAALGYTPVSGAQTNTAMSTKTVGAGIGIIWNDEGGQTTADESSSSFGKDPHDPPDESTGVKTIIKNYRTVNDTTNVVTDDGCTHRDNVDEHIIVEEEGDYKVVGWKTSNTRDYGLSSITWPVPGRVTHQGSTSGSVTLSSPIETVVYVLLEKHTSLETGQTGESDFIISQSTITRKIKLSMPDSGKPQLVKLKDTIFYWKSAGHTNSCSGHSHNYTCGGCQTDPNDETKKICPGHTCSIGSCTYGKWTDNSVKFSLKNNNRDSYPDVVATKANWENITTTGAADWSKRYKPGTRSIVGASQFSFGSWDYACILLRGKDKLTVANWKNNNLGCSEANNYLRNVSSSGFAIADSLSGTRKTSLYYDSFKFTIADDSPDKGITYSTTAGVSCSTHSGNSYNCGSNSQSYSLSTSFTADAGVRVETYSGSASGTQNDTYYNGNTTSFSKFPDLNNTKDKNKVSGIEVPSGSSISFLPYIQMNYDTNIAKHEAYGSSSQGHKTAYVLGTITRTMTPNDYAEVSWRSRDANKPNLTISSLQWSTHASATDFINSSLSADPRKWNVLPGGATLDLKINDTDRQKVAVTTYQVIVDGTGKEQINKAGGSYGSLDAGSAESSHDTFVDSVVNALDKLTVEQWVTDDLSGINGSSLETLNSAVWYKNNSSAVSWGSDLTCAGNSGQTANNDIKYYLSDDGGRAEAPASEGDLDVEVVNKESKKYTFYINTYGEMYMIIDDPNGNMNGERVGTLITPGNLTGIAKAINDRTHVVDKLYKATEHGTGNDASGRSKTGTRWYNEAFDGVTVYVQSTQLSVGFLEPPQRSTVLDPKLTQKQDNQRDMFNVDKYNMSQFRTKNYSAYYGDEEKVGEFKGASVYMEEMNMLFFSKQFFIPNATVDDLH